MSQRKYRPSNGSEGMWFVETYCSRCIHEKFMHTNDHEDKKCDIFSNTLIFNVNEKGYPEEWIYDDNENPKCTAHGRWDWGRDDDEGGLNEPPPIYPDNPNQLCMPFIFDELNIKQHECESSPLPSLT